TDLERPLQQISREPTLRFDGLQDPGPEELEQPRYDDHDRRLHFLDVRSELFEALGAINLRAERDRKHLSAHMLIGVACGQEGQEHLIVPTEVGRDDVGRSFEIVEDRAMVLADSAWSAARAAGVDDAGEVTALDPRHLGLEIGDARLPRRELLPMVAIDPVRRLA